MRVDRPIKLGLNYRAVVRHRDELLRAAEYQERGGRPCLSEYDLDYVLDDEERMELARHYRREAARLTGIACFMERAVMKP